MAPTRRRFLGAVTSVGAVGLAGCADGGPPGGGNATNRTSEPSPTATRASTEAEPAEVTVAVRSHADHGDILVDDGGRTLYMFEGDEQGGTTSACTGQCASTWQPLTVDGEPVAGDGVTAEVDAIERADGTRQVTANGWPLYYFGADTVAGEVGGQGFENDWWVLAPDGTPRRSAPADVTVTNQRDHGDVLADGEGRILYAFDGDAPGSGESACVGDCAETWPPLTVEGEPAVGESVSAEIDTIERPDGATQVTANGRPLYYFADDDPGEAGGHGVGDDWWVLATDGAPKRPASAMVRVRSHPDHGEILVDADGRTLYAFDSDEPGAGESACTGDCAEAWPPFTAEDGPERGEDVTAELGAFERADGARQVTADGWPLYYFAEDDEPGDAAGQGVEGVWWVLDPAGVPKREDGTETTADSGGGGGASY